MNAIRWLPALLLLVAILTGAGYFLQRQQSAMLREQIALLQRDHQRLEQLRTENAELKAAQLSEAELSRLRADHFAVERLRAELNTLRESIHKAEEAAASKQGS